MAQFRRARSEGLDGIANLVCWLYGLWDTSLFKNFTRRHHLDHREIELRYEFVPQEFRYDLFKLMMDRLPIEGLVDDSGHIIVEYGFYRTLAVSINADYLRLFAVEDMFERYSSDLLIDLLLKAKWHEVLSMVECFLNTSQWAKIEEVNDLFEYHCVGYEAEEHSRRDNRVIVKYSSLIQDTDEILQTAIPYAPVHQSISAAREALIDPKNIDVAASVKHSIDAVEAYVRGWLYESKNVSATTLGDAIKKMRGKAMFPLHILNALEQFYAYRCSTPNVGHGSPTFASLEKEDALLCNEMAISFINYFHRRAGIVSP